MFALVYVKQPFKGKKEKYSWDKTEWFPTTYCGKPSNCISNVVGKYPVCGCQVSREIAFYNI
jgi:hypothetical protein